MSNLAIFVCIVFWFGMATLAILGIGLLSTIQNRLEERSTRGQIQSVLDGLGSGRMQ